MKKIRIATIHFVYNYGAMLQTYALQKYLQNYKYDVAVLDYRPYFIDTAYRLYIKDFFSKPKYAIKKFIVRIIHPHKFSKFEQFLYNHINLIPMKKFYNDQPSCDVLIAGSDQVWNPAITYNDDFYYLNLPNLHNKKISYASSIALDYLDDSDSVNLRNKIRTFDAISVRERSAKILIDNLGINIPISVVLDPIFLLTRNEWISLEKSCNKVTFKYLLYYSLEANEELERVVKLVSKKMKLKIVSIHPLYYIYNDADININNIGPREYLWLIRNAEFIITNSFHGTAFSILFARKFISIPFSNTGSRMRELCEQLQLEKHLLESNGDSVHYFQLNETSEKNLMELIKKSKDYLNQALGV